MLKFHKISPLLRSLLPAAFLSSCVCLTVSDPGRNPLPEQVPVTSFGNTVTTEVLSDPVNGTLRYSIQGTADNVLMGKGYITGNFSSTLSDCNLSTAITKVNSEEALTELTSTLTLSLVNSFEDYTTEVKSISLTGIKTKGAFLYGLNGQVSWTASKGAIGEVLRKPALLSPGENLKEDITFTVIPQETPAGVFNEGHLNGAFVSLEIKTYKMLSDDTPMYIIGTENKYQTVFIPVGFSIRAGKEYRIEVKPGKQKMYSSQGQEKPEKIYYNPGVEDWEELLTGCLD